MKFSELSAGFRELLSETFNMLLTFPEDIGTLMNEKKTLGSGYSPKGADAQKKMSFPRCSPHAVHAALHTRSRSIPVESERLQMVLEKHGHVREEFCQRILKFIKLEFMGVERVRTG